MIRLPWTSKPWLNVGTAPGPIGAWPMNEGAGPTLLNAASGLGACALSGAPAWGSGPDGRALGLNGTSQWGTVPANILMRPAAGWTILARVAPSASQASRFLWRADDVTNRISLTQITAGVSTWTVSGRTYTSGSVGAWTGTTALAVNTWHDIAVTFDASSLVGTAYVDGRREATVTGSGTPYVGSGSPVLTIGADNGGTGSWLAGSIGYLAFWPRPLSAAEIAARAENPWLDFAPRVAFRAATAGVVVPWPLFFPTAVGG